MRLGVVGGRIALSATATTSGGMRLDHPLADATRSSANDAEVTRVDADDARLDRERAVELGGVVHLDEHGEARGRRRGRGGRAAARRRARRRSAAPRRRPSPRASSIWSASTVKSLRSTGTLVAARAATRSATAPAEVGPVGEHRQAGGASGLVGRGGGGGVEVGREVALRRRPALDLRDHAEVRVAAQRTEEVARRRCVGQRGPSSARRGASASTSACFVAMISASTPLIPISGASVPSGRRMVPRILSADGDVPDGFLRSTATFSVDLDRVLARRRGRRGFLHCSTTSSGRSATGCASASSPSTARARRAP